MIVRDCTILLKSDSATLSETLVLYKGDQNIEYTFTLKDNAYKFSNGTDGNIVTQLEASYAQILWYKNAEIRITFPIQATNDGKVVLKITKELIDEDNEIGDYDFQIRLYDSNKEAILTLPPLLKAVHIKAPLFEKDPLVDLASADVSTLVTAGPEETIYGTDGNYLKTTWVPGMIITSAKLNKIETALYDACRTKTAGDISLTDTSGNFTSDNVEGALSEINSQIKDKANKSEIGTPLIANTVAEMTDTSKVYVYTGSEAGYISGNWYSHNGTSWVSGGVYNSRGIGDREITPIKTNFFNKKIGDNLFDGNFDESGYIASTGENASSSRFKRTSKYYEIPPGSSTIYILLSEATTTFTIMYYDSSDAFLGFISSNNTTSSNRPIPANTKKFRVYTEGTFDGNACISVKELKNHVPYEENYKLNLALEDNLITFDMFSEDLKNILNKGGKNIINFGDSIFGNTQNDTSISSYLSNYTGYNVVNAGFGGCRMAYRGSSEVQNAWSAFSMYALVDAICSGDWTYQDSNVNYGTGTNNAIPSYFANTLNILKSIDFNTIDLITIAYGTNDYRDGNEFDNVSNKFDINTFLGALRYSLKKIQTKYPKIKIIVITPIWRYFKDGTDSDIKTWGTGTLPDYVEGIKSACKEFKVPVLDSYYNMGLSIYNANYYFEDYTHLNSIGRKDYAKLISSEINRFI